MSKQATAQSTNIMASFESKPKVHRVPFVASVASSATGGDGKCKYFRKPYLVWILAFVAAVVLLAAFFIYQSKSQETDNGNKAETDKLLSLIDASDGIPVNNGSNLYLKGKEDTIVGQTTKLSPKNSKPTTNTETGKVDAGVPTKQSLMDIIGKY
jgi:hypothetical protein